MGISKEMTANQALRTATQTVKDQPKRNRGNRAGGGNSRYVAQEKQPSGGYRFAMRAAGYDLVRKLSAEGNSYATIADALGIGPDAFRRIREQDEKLKEALAVGHGALATELTDILLSQARNGNTVAAIFLAKARLGWIEGRAAEAPPASPVQVNIQIPPPMSDAEFRRVIDGKAASESEEPSQALPGPGGRARR
jgi:hypothetical protein